MKKNRLRELLKKGKPTIGTHVMIPWPGVFEVIGQSGVFDYIEYLGEYSPFSLELLDNFARAIDRFPDMSSMMKVEEQNKGFIATRAIDAGIQNVLFTDCRSATDVEQCINLVRAEIPGTKGTHGAGMRRNVEYVSNVGTTAWVKAMDEVVIAIMIEKKGAMDELEEILSLKGVDMVQFGPVDYSISIGKPRKEPSDPVSEEVNEAHNDMIRMATAKGIAPRVEINSFKEASRYVDMGVRHFCIGWDLKVISDWCKDQDQGIKELTQSISK